MDSMLSTKLHKAFSQLTINPAIKYCQIDFNLNKLSFLIFFIVEYIYYIYITFE